ncbi:MAG: GtrA family protein [Thermodesulfobacteriota bacterium]
MTKRDYINSIIVGEIIALFFLILLFTLRAEIPEKLTFILELRLFFPFIFPLLGFAVINISSSIGKRWFIVSQLGKFCFVGLSNFMVDFGILNLLIYFTGHDKGILFSVFKGISFIFALINSYTWNKFWTFESVETKSVFRQFLKFFSVISAGLVVNVAIASFVVNKYGSSVAVSSTLWANFGALISLVFTVLWNFFGLRFFVFKSPD